MDRETGGSGLNGALPHVRLWVVKRLRWRREPQFRYSTHDKRPAHSTGAAGDIEGVSAHSIAHHP